MATKKRTPTKRKPRKRKTYRPKKNYKKIILNISIFVGFLLFSILALFYLKSSETSDVTAKISEEQLNDKINYIDKSLKEILFDLGVSSKEVTRQKDKRISKDELTWDLKEREFLLGKKISNTNFNNLFNKTIKSDDIELIIKSEKKSINADIKAYGYQTHKLKFRLKDESKKIVKVEKSDKKLKNKTVAITKPPDKKVVAEKKTAKPETKTYAKSGKPKIVIIIDDVGLDKKIVDKIMDIKKPLNIAILPHLPYSEYAARNAHINGMDVILHQPMEPKESSGYTAEDAGEGVLRVGNSKDEILRRFENNLASIPHLDGVNNHMGSKFTENKELMELVLKRIKSEDLYFIDSLTSNKSYGYSLAKQFGIKTDRRDIFLDNSTRSKKYVKAQLNKLVNVAKRDGVAIGICHSYIQTVEVLSEYLPYLEDQVEVATVTSILN